MTFSQGFSDARTRARQGIVGDWVYADGARREGDGLNAYPQAAQVTTVTVTDQGDNDDVTITINGVNVVINTGTGGDAASIGALLAAAINAEPLVRGQVKASFATATLTLTGLTPGLAFTVSIAGDASTVLSAVTAVTAAASASVIPFGRALVFNGYNAGGDSIGETERLLTLPLAAFFSAQVATLAFGAFVTAQVNTIYVYEVRGNERILIASVSEAAATDRDTTIDALVALLNTALPANTVLAAADAGTATAIVFTAKVPGYEFAIEALAGHEGATLQSLTLTDTTGPSKATSLVRAWLGSSLYSPCDIVPNFTDTDGSYPANATVNYAVRGVVWVASAESPAMGDTVYVETVAGATCGRFYAAASSTRVALPRRIARWERDGLVSSDSIAALRLEAA